MKSGKAVITTLTAAFAGMLLAPRKGSVTRKKIAEKSRRYVDVASSMFRTSADKITRRIRTGNKNTSKTIKKRKEIVKEGSGKGK